MQTITEDSNDNDDDVVADGIFLWLWYAIDSTKCTHYSAKEKLIDLTDAKKNPNLKCPG